MKLPITFLAILICFPSSLPLSTIPSPPSPQATQCRGISKRNDPSLSSGSSPSFRIAVIGGGASAMFAATTAASRIRESSAGVVTVYEAGEEVLRSVRISAGGRENILFDPSALKLRELLNAGYPRGKNEILSMLSKEFPPTKQQKWFEDRGVTFSVEKDGRMLTIPDSGNDDDMLPSSTVCDAILDEATKAGVQICTRVKIIAISKEKDSFVISKMDIEGGNFEEEWCDCVILATGNSHSGLSLAKSFNHTIQGPFRSCFGFRSSNRDKNSSEKARSDYKVPISSVSDGIHKIHRARLTLKIKVPGQKRPRIFKKEGPVEVLICGNSVKLTGMAAFNLASIAAPELKRENYSGTILIHFCPDIGKVERVEEILWDRRQDQRYASQRLGEQCPLVHEEIDYDNYDFETDTFPRVNTECVPQDIWENLCQNSGATSNYKWSQMSPKKIRALADLTVGYEFKFEGKHTSRDEFVNGGGVSLNEIDMPSMKSKIIDGLILCGQILDGDGAHGGFTFMRDFGSGFIAGKTAANYAVQNQSGL